MFGKQLRTLNLIKRSSEIKDIFTQTSNNLQILNRDITEEQEYLREKIKEFMSQDVILNKEKTKNMNIINSIDTLLNGTSGNDVTPKENSGTKE